MSTRFQCEGDLALFVDRFAVWFQTLPDWIVVMVSPMPGQSIRTALMEIKCQRCKESLKYVEDNWQSQMETFAKKHGDCE